MTCPVDHSMANCRLVTDLIWAPGQAGRGEGNRQASLRFQMDPVLLVIFLPAVNYFPQTDFRTVQALVANLSLGNYQFNN